MVSTQGFNALLKLVEEPPEHLKFIFATTEPEKVIATIRSRTHHYPFRLIPPRVLSDYLAEICAQEGVTIDPAALPLVVRAGAGSARDSLSVLDQLLGGAGPEGVTYDVATGLLGYTPDNLLDEVVDAFAAHDGAGVFRRRRQGDRDRPGPAPLHRGPPAPPARPGHRRRRARRPGLGPDRRTRGPGRATRRPGRPVRQGRAGPRRRHRRRRADRDARRHDPAAAARAGLRPGAAARRPTTTSLGFERAPRPARAPRLGRSAAPRRAAARPPSRPARAAPPKPRPGPGARPSDAAAAGARADTRRAGAPPSRRCRAATRPAAGTPEPTPAAPPRARCSAWPTYAGSGRPARAGQEDAAVHLDPAEPERPGDRRRRARR